MKKQSTFLAWIMRMPLIQRWGLMHSVKPENVAEHSHQVAVISHLLVVISNCRYGGILNPEKAATIALFHEVSETKLQDVNSRTKYHNAEFTKQFKKLEEIAEKECLKTLPNDIAPQYERLVVQNNVSEDYKKLIKAADLLAAYIKTLDELKFGNVEFEHVKTNLESRLETYKNEMPEVRDFIEEFLDSCLVSLDELS